MKIRYTDTRAAGKPSKVGLLPGVRLVPGDIYEVPQGVGDRLVAGGQFEMVAPAPRGRGAKRGSRP